MNEAFRINPISPEQKKVERGEKISTGLAKKKRSEAGLIGSSTIKTYCKHGREFTRENVCRITGGNADCLPCCREMAAYWRNKAREIRVRRNSGVIQMGESQ
jgi:hypothetical protein